MSEQRILAELVRTLNENWSTIISIEEEDIRKEIFKELCEQVYSRQDSGTVQSLQLMIQYMTDIHTVEEIFENLNNRLENEALIQSEKRERQENFDASYGTKTSQILEQFEMNELISIERLINSTCYYPSPINSVRAGIEHLEKHQVCYEEACFIDIGSGMGRNLLIAADYPFRKIMGVEISSYLHQIAEANIAKYKSPTQRCHNFELCCTDALNFEFPEGDLVIYFWEPFSEMISNRFVEKLNQFAQHSSSDVTLIFLEGVFPAIKKSEDFTQIDHFKTDVLISEGLGNYQISIFSSAKIITL